MRVSVNSSDKGYVQNPWDYEVYFNGVKCETCVTADEELGEAIVFERLGDVFTGETISLKGEVVIKDIRNEN